ncbi:MAG TPA: site-specific integrase, partial [Kineosporiaceae bacterium]|nr:site-specific integrase [Kineosporiaceae bacterium]
VRSVFKSAALDRLIGSSPAARITLPRHETPRIVPLTAAQVQALAEAMPERYRALVVAQAGLGLRISELLGLQPEDIGWLELVVRVRHQLQRDGQLGPPKTPRSIRDVPLPRFVADEVSAHLARWPAGKTLWTAEQGQPVRHDWYGAHVFKRAVRDAGLPASTSPHDLRHAFASWLLAAGESVVAVAERLGHENATLVLTTYGHLVPGSEDRTRRALDAAWSASDPGVTRLGVERL